MLRNSINVYLHAFLSLARDKGQARLPLIREALTADSLIELIQEWVWLQELDLSSALKIKIWFQLGYSDLSKVFGVSEREVSQALRNQRISNLPTYRTDSTASGDFSCFMLEQHLSPWMDSEIADLKTVESVREHLNSCEACHGRLVEFRGLQSRILAERQSFDSISEAEWDSAIRFLLNDRRRMRLKVLSMVFGLALLSSLIAWAIFSKPDKMPNVYEILR